MNLTEAPVSDFKVKALEDGLVAFVVVGLVGAMIPSITKNSMKRRTVPELPTAITLML